MSSKYLPLVVVVALLIFSGWQFSKVKEGFTPTPNTTFEEHITLAKKSLTRADSLLAFELKGSQQSFTLKGRSPFGDKVRRVYRKRAQGPAFERVPLQLKGILEGGQTLALLENGGGRTFIVASGDTLFERKIRKITKSSVIVKDRNGLETLKVSD